VRVLVSFVALFLIAVVLFLPWTMIGFAPSEPPARPPAPPSGGPAADEPIQLKVFHAATRSIISLPLEEYVVGVVAAEMPASFSPEALKAQAVLARTYAVAKLPRYGGQGSVLSRGADISTDPRHDQAWMGREEMRARWGFVNYYLYSRKIRKAVEETRDLVLTYQGGLIEAVYHSTSGGMTENAQDVWGHSYPYLVSVPSPIEAFSPHWRTDVRVSLNRLASCLGVSRSLLLAESQNPAREVIEVVSASRTGRVTEVKVGGKTFNGHEFRHLLGLPSTWWTWTLEGDAVIFSTRGYGHGVGLSQFGAEGYAREGRSFVDILRHYYPGTWLQDLDSVQPVLGQ